MSEEYSSLDGENKLNLRLTRKAWNLKKVPDSGWEFVRFVKYHSYRHCVICGSRLSNVHYISHEDIGTVGIGKNCAAKIFGTFDYAAEEKRVKALMAEAQMYVGPDVVERLSGITWRQSKYGNYYKDFGNFIIKIVPNEVTGRFSFAVTSKLSSPTLEAAEEALHLFIRQFEYPNETPEHTEEEEC